MVIIGSIKEGKREVFIIYLCSTVKSIRGIKNIIILTINIILFMGKGRKNMKYFEKVRSTKENVQKLELNVDTVYIRENILRKQDDEGNPYWEYNETQLSFEEYFKKVFPENEKAIIELCNLICLYQNQVDESIAEITLLLGGK